MPGDLREKACIEVKLIRTWKLAVLLVTLLLVLSSSMPAQSDNASISGVVKDPGGALVPGAKIVLTDERTTFERRTTSNGAGYYIFPSVPPGMYSISAEAAGFKQVKQTHNEIIPAMAASVNLALEIGVVTESVSVSAAVGAVLPDSGTLGNVVEGDVISTMALSGRDALYAALLVPGVKGDILNTLTFGTGGATNTSINGAPPRTADITYDGASGYRTRNGTYTVGAVDADAVQEVQVLTSAYSAEYGGASGGQIRVVTRGGGQTFHGNLFEYVENTALNGNDWSRNDSSTTACPYTGKANNACTNSVPATTHYNQFGFNLNGPIYIPKRWNVNKSKLFFYFGQEYTKYIQPASSSMTIPSAAMRTGDFSELLVKNNQFFSAGLQLKDPTTGAPIPNNVIPTSQMSQSGLGLLNEFPSPQGNFQSGYNWIGYSDNTQNQVKNTGSLDYNPTEKHMIRFRSNYTWNNQYMPYYSAGDRTPVSRDWFGETASINYTWTVSPTILNELLVAASRDVVTNVVDYAVSANRTLYGINYPYLYPGTKVYNDKIPDVSIQGLTTESATKYPARSAGPVYRLNETLTKIHTEHSFKFGFSLAKTGENDKDQTTGSTNGGTTNQNGAFTFTNSRGGAATTGSAIANAALGLFDTYSEYGTKSYTPYRNWLEEFFAQDGWKVNAKLRVEVGARFTINHPNYSLWNNIMDFDPTLYNPAQKAVISPSTGFILSGNNYDGWVIPGSGWPAAAVGRVPIATSGQYNDLFHNYPRGFAETHYNLQPRVGIAYQFAGGVIRAGGGRFMEQPRVSDNIFPGGQPPFQPQAEVLDGSVNNPGGGGTDQFPGVMYTMDRKNPITETYNWNVTYSRKIPLKSMLEVSYVGSRSLHDIIYRNINQLVPGTTYDFPTINANYLRPYAGYAQISLEDPSGTSKREAFQLNWTRHISHGLIFGVAYTRESMKDDTSDNGTAIANAWNRTAMWGYSDYDRPNVMVIHYVYELPFFKNYKSWLGKTMGGWSVSGVSQFQSGAYTGISVSSDYAGVGPGGGPQYWVTNGNPILTSSQQAFSHSNSDSNYWFAVKSPNGTPIFTQPPNGTFAPEYNRNYIEQPGFQNWNLAGFKDFHVREKDRITFRAEAFNWINHPNWAGANTSPTATAFGKVQSKNAGARTLQLSLRYAF
jgi:hypothetical protein